MARKILIIAICGLFLVDLNSQNRWTQNYLAGENPYGESLIEHYDKGYLLAGRFGPNYPIYCWLIKTDVNGDLLWRKVIGDGLDYTIISSDIAVNEEGGVYLAGSTYSYSDNDSDPLIMKMNTCGEKEWCKVFYEEGNNYSNEVAATPDGGCVVVLRYMNVDLKKDRICLTKLDTYGTLKWKKCYNSSDTNIYNQDAKDLIICPDGGYLISGYCGYQDPEPPHYIYAKPYFIKTDSSGNFEWDQVIHSEGSEMGGRAWSTVISPDSNYFYSSISHFYNSAPTGDAPALLKMDMAGYVIDIYDLASPAYYGKMIDAKFITDTTLMASAVWGSEWSGLPPKAVIIDTLGNIVYQHVLLDNEWMAHTAVTFDSKLLFFTNLHDDQDNFDAYLFKLDQNLLSDSIYTQPFIYDSLCPHAIVSDTIVQDDCGLIVGMEEIYAAKSESENKVLIYPNPASGKFKVQSLMFEVGGCDIEVYDLFGRKVKEIQLSNGQSEMEVNTTGWQRGLYVVKVTGKDGMIGSGKIVVK